MGEERKKGQIWLKIKKPLKSDWLQKILKVLHSKTKQKNPLWSHFEYYWRQWQPTPVLLPGKSHGQSSLEGCSPWGQWRSDMTERLHFHFSLSYIGERNCNPLQRSCLENPRDGGAWWAAVYGVAQSQTWLQWLSSSSIVLILQYFLV